MEMRFAEIRIDRWGHLTPIYTFTLSIVPFDYLASLRVKISSRASRPLVPIRNYCIGRGSGASIFNNSSSFDISIS